MLRTYCSYIDHMELRLEVAKKISCHEAVIEVSDVTVVVSERLFRLIWA